MKQNLPPVPPVLVLVIGVLAVSTSGIFVKLAGAPPLVIGLWRCTLSTGVLLPFAIPFLRRDLPHMSRREGWIALGAGFFLAIHFTAWIASLQYIAVASSVVLVNTVPIWVALLTPFISTDRISSQTTLGILLSCLGIVVIGLPDLRFTGDALWGNLLAVTGAITFAFYLLLGRRLQQKISFLSYVVLCYGTAAVVLLMLVLATGQPILDYPPRTIGWMMAVGLVPQLIGHTSYNWALRWLSAAFVSVALLGEPIGATLLAWAILDEAPQGPILLGGALVLAGIYMVARAETEKGG